MVGSFIAKHKYILLTFLILNWNHEQLVVDLLFETDLLRGDSIIGSVLNAEEQRWTRQSSYFQKDYVLGRGKIKQMYN